MTGEQSKNFHGVGIGPLSKILAVKGTFFSLMGLDRFFSWFWIQMWMIKSWYSDMHCTFFSLWFGNRYLWLQELIFIGRGKLEIRIDHRTVSSLAGISTSRTSFKIHAECIVHFKLYVYFEQFCRNKLQCAYVCITASKVTLEMIWVFLKIELFRNDSWGLLAHDLLLNLLF